MMHDPTGHPEEERLSALAAGDADALDDGALRRHVEGCARCGAMVGDLRNLRAALAQLPDIAPSRPLRLLPPVAPETPQRRFGGFTGRLFAPALAAGLVLMVAGGIGTIATSGVQLLTSAGARGAPAAAESTDDRGVPAVASPGDGSYVQGERDEREPFGGRAGAPLGPEPASEVPWVLVLGAGVVLVLVALILRFAISPRAG